MFAVMFPVLAISHLRYSYVSENFPKFTPFEESPGVLKDLARSWTSFTEDEKAVR